ncbi:hypothetical protein [Candidatus Borrarchaeum sp.]|uniref:hypothetical protein n=1 Tax=Candidatus Borrarchaeum sp. TaxID=2846742 RepID=UPI00257A2456|nr:hypothetical protein [Candidatus Borrarchaeum sp.]
MGRKKIKITDEELELESQEYTLEDYKETLHRGQLCFAVFNVCLTIVTIGVLLLTLNLEYIALLSCINFFFAFVLFLSLFEYRKNESIESSYTKFLKHRAYRRRQNKNVPRGWIRL